MITFVLAALFAGTTVSQPQMPELKASMVVLGVSDVSRSVKFYKDTLGLPSAPAPGDLPMFRAGSVTIVLNPALGGNTGAFELVFPVESVSIVRNQLSNRGCRFIAESREVAPRMWVATFTDPDGYRLTLFGGH